MFKYHIKGKITCLDWDDENEDTDYEPLMFEVDTDVTVDCKDARAAFKKWLEEEGHWDDKLDLSIRRNGRIFSVFVGFERDDIYLTATLIT